MEKYCYAKIEKTKAEITTETPRFNLNGTVEPGTIIESYTLSMKVTIDCSECPFGSARIGIGGPRSETDSIANRAITNFLTKNCEQLVPREPTILNPRQD